MPHINVTQIDFDFRTNQFNVISSQLRNYTFISFSSMFTYEKIRLEILNLEL